MTGAMAFVRGLVTALPAVVVLLTGGCERAGSALDITGQVSGVVPRPVGPERLRVTLPERNVQAVLGPVSRNGDVTVWQTLDGITLGLRRGLLTGTRGLGDDLMSSDVSNSLGMVHGSAGDGYYPHIRSYLDGEDRTVFRSFQCRREEPHEARRIVETCVSPRRDFTNIYWLDGNGTVFKTRQWVSPAIGYMETERVLR